MASVCGTETQGMGDPHIQWHRLTIAILAVLLIIAALGTILLAWIAPDASLDRLNDFTDFLADHNDRDGKLILTLAAVVVILLMACVLIVEVLPPSNQLRVGDVESGVVAITTSQIAQRVEASVADVDQVSAAKATVSRRGNRVEVVLDLDVEAGADLARTADEACRRAHHLVERQLRIELAARPRARLHYRELRLTSAGNESPPATGWERPQSEEPRDDRRSTDAPEEAQA